MSFVELKDQGVNLDRDVTQVVESGIVGPKVAQNDSTNHKFHSDKNRTFEDSGLREFLGETLGLLELKL